MQVTLSLTSSLKSSSFCPSVRSLFLRPFSFIPFDRLLSFLETVQFHFFGSSNFIFLYRPVSRGYFPPLDQYFPIFALLTVHYRISGPSTFAATFSDNASSLSRSSLALVWHASSLSHFTYVSLSHH